MFGKEPAVFFGGIGEILRAVIPMALIFGWVAWSDTQTGAVMLVVNVVLGFLTTMLTRSAVVPTETANRQIDVALKMPATATKGQVIAEAKSQE